MPSKVLRGKSGGGITVTKDSLGSDFTPGSSDTWLDTGLEVTITAGASEVVELRFEGNINNSSSTGFGARFRFDVAGDPTEQIYYFHDFDGTQRIPLSMSLFSDALAGGSTTIKVQMYWASAGSAPVLQGDDTAGRRATLTVIQR